MTLPIAIIGDPVVIHRLALRGDGIEVSAVREVDGAFSHHCEVCTEAEATMWSVYIHIDGEGVDCVADWQTYLQAHAHAAELLAAYPNLAHHGIYNGSHP